MECFGNYFNKEWHGLNPMFMEDEDSDQFHKQGLISNQCDLGLNFELSHIFLRASDDSSNVDSFFVDDEHLRNVVDNINPNFYHFLSQENSINSTDATNDTSSLPYSYEGSIPFCSSNIVPSPSNDICDTSIQYCMMDEINNSSSPTQVFSNANICLPLDVVLEKVSSDNSLVSGRENSLKGKPETTLDAVEDEVNNEKSDKNPKKRSRVSRENVKNKKNVKSKKNQKMNETEDGSNNNNNGERNGQTSSSCSSNDEQNDSQEMNTTVNPNAKTRASRGTATDPQSLYARKRRERINERLRILQHLVPNGTKLDISTMLEEAVEYVKFLKLQIQLLSSDDTWMYAPIAYNGMDMGLYQNITPNSKDFAYIKT